MTRKTLTALMLAAGLSLASVRAGDAKTGKPAKKVTLQTTCPAMGGKINKKLYVDAKGKRIYVCCKGCISAVKKTPATYIKKLEDQGVTVASLQTTCPVMGGKINKKLYADVDGKRVYVCCGGCIGKVKKDPAKYIGKAEAQGVVFATAAPAAKGHEGHKH